MSKENQVGGSHYASKKIDPFTFAMANNWDPMLFSILKYLTRYKDKGTPLQDLEKAMHIAEYRKNWPKPLTQKRLVLVSVYCEANDLDSKVQEVLEVIEGMYDGKYWAFTINSLMAEVIRLTYRIYLLEKGRIEEARTQRQEVKIVNHSVVTSPEQAERLATRDLRQTAAILRDEKRKADRS